MHPNETSKTSDPTAVAHQAQLLRTIFPSNAPSHLVWSGFTAKDKKRVKDLNVPARQKMFEWHLTRTGSAGMGLKPYCSSRSADPSTSWMMLDFDAHAPEDLGEVFPWLAEHLGLTPLFNRGSTGRGAHLWFLLEAAVPVTTAFRVLSGIADEVQRRGFTRPEVRPSNGGSSPGAGVLLPYRGAASDGYGPQPLYDPETGAALTLLELSEFPRGPVAPLLAYRPVARPQALTTRTTSALGVSMPGETDPEARWDAELTRAEDHFEEGRRQHLVVALSALGLQLGRSPAQVERDVMQLVDRLGGAERDMRRSGVLATLRRAENGQPIAVSHFYRQAGLPPPARSVAPEVLRQVWALRTWMLGYAWPGPTGFTARSVFLVLLTLAQQHGLPHPQGVEVAVSWRELTERSDLGSRTTLQKALGVLEGAGVLLRAARGAGERAGSFVLILTDETTLSKGDSRGGSIFATPAFRRGKGRLGKPAEALFDLVLTLGPLTTASLAERLARPAGNLKGHLVKLLQAGLIEEAGGHFDCWGAAPDWAAALGEAEQRTGVGQARLQQKVRHENERDLYRSKPWVKRLQDKLCRETTTSEADAPSASGAPPPEPD